MKQGVARAFPIQLGIYLLTLLIVLEVGYLSSVKGATLAPPIYNIEPVLEKVVWDSTTRGPLIVVGADTIRPAWQSLAPSLPPPLPNELPPPPVALPDGRYRLTDITDYFDCRIVRLNGLTILAPKEMAVLTADPGKPDIYVNLSRNEKLQLFFATLRAEQWKRLGSASGLGYSDLDGEQHDLYLSFLSEQVRINTITQVDVEKDIMSAIRNAEKNQIHITGEQRKQIRIKLSRRTIITVPAEGINSDYEAGISSDSSDTIYRSLQSAVGENQRTNAFGQTLRRIVPNHLKTQQIDFSASALHTSIRLTGLKTAGDLVQRIRQITHVEIYIDGRAGKLPLFVRADEAQFAPAGELLKALCWGLKGAVRQVSDGQQSVFILAEDSEGVGARMTRLGDWYTIADSQKSKRMREAAEKIRSHNPMNYLTFEEGDKLALSSDLMKRVEAKWSNMRSRRSGVSMPLTELTPEQQDRVRRGVVEYNAQRLKNSLGEPFEITNVNTIKVKVDAGLQLLVPDVGEVKVNNTDLSFVLLPLPTSYGDEMTPAQNPLAHTLAIPTRMALGGVLCISPKTVDETKELVRTAKERGIRQVWIELPVSLASVEINKRELESAKSLLIAAISEIGNKPGSPIIVPAVRLLTLPPESISLRDESIINRTINGESELQRTLRLKKSAEVAGAEKIARNTISREWVQTETPALATRLCQRLTELVSIPGIGGLVLLDASAPGYANYSAFEFPYNGASVKFPGYLGYTNRSRIELIRSVGYDPIDLLETWPSITIDTRLSPFTNESIINSDASPIDIRAYWLRIRAKEAERFLVDLYPRLLKILPQTPRGFPIYLAGMDSATSSDNRFLRWDRAEMLPRHDLKLPKAKSFTSLISCDLTPLSQPLSEASLSPLSLETRFAHLVNDSLHNHPGDWDGLVLDFREVPADTIVTALKGIRHYPEPRISVGAGTERP